MSQQSIRLTSELERIIALPRRRINADEWKELPALLTDLLRTDNGTQTLRPVQAMALHDIGVTGGGFFPIGVGEGKTLISLLAPYVLDAKRPLLILPASLIQKTIRESVKYARHWRIPKHIRLFSYEMLGRVQASGELEAYQPDLIVTDECFVAGTLVRTLDGLRKIETIDVGDAVWAFDGKTFSAQHVEEIGARETNETFVLSVEGYTYEVTGNHPFLTNEGWKSASKIQPGDHIVCDMRKNVHRDFVHQPKVLREVLLCEVENVSARDSREGPQCESACEDLCLAPEGPSAGPSRGFCRENAQTQSNEERGDESKGSNCASSFRMETKDARRQREGNASPASSPSGSAGSWMGCREANAVGKLGHSCISNRYLPRRNENSCRSGWGLARSPYCESSGQAQDGVSGGTRLARVESNQRRDRSEPGQSCLVYNFHVSGPSTYVLESGLVVHNCHKLKNRKAAVTRRVARYLHDHPETKFIGMSGTIMRRSLLDFGNILRWCLKGNSPVPKSEHELEEWALALDEKVTDEARFEPGALLHLCTPDEILSNEALDKPIVAARKGFQRRLTETPGIVATAGEAERVACSIYVKAITYEVKPITEAHFYKLRNQWLTPDDWVLCEAVDVWRHARELSLGFHYVWSPRPPDAWREARRDWHAFVREVLSRSRTLDSELDVANACDAGKLSSEALQAWRAIRNTFVPNTVAIWHDDTVLKLCTEWMKKPGIVWTSHSLFARKLAEATGATYYGAEGLSDDGTKFIEDASPKEAVIASMKANREGRNLQTLWNRNLVVSPPDGADAWQQMIGRTHRPGQLADEVTFDVLLGCREHANAWRKAHSSAYAIRDTIGAEQKLLLADIEWPTDEEIESFKGARWEASPEVNK